MEPMQMSLDEKQNLLRNEILQGGLDPHCFMDYMGTVRNQGENIELDNWTMQQLKQVVLDFKMQIKADTDTLQKVKISQMRQSQQILQKIIRSVIKKQKVNYEKGLWDFEILNQQECKSFPKPFQFNSKIKPKIHVLSWQVRSHGGFFLGIGATKQLWLKLETNFTQKPVQRSNSDLQWYRNVLLKSRPGSYIPPLSQLRAVQPQDKKGLAQRAKMVEQFLNSVVQYEHLIQSEVSKIVLTEQDNNKFTNLKNKQRNTSYSKNVGRIQTLQGKFQLEISQRSQKFNKNCTLFCRVAQQTYKQIQTQINKVLSDMQTLSKHVLYVSNSCGVLHQKYTKICGLNQIKDSSMDTIMIYLNNLFASVGKNIKEQMDLIKQFSDEFIQSDIRSWEEFLLHDKRYQRQIDNYLSFKTELIRKKQRYFNDVTKWELGSEKQFQKISRMNMSVMEKDQILGMMFPKDNKAEEQLRIWVAYLNRVYENSFKMFLKQQEGRLKQKFSAYIEQYANLNHLNTSNVKQFQQILAIGV